MRLSVLIFFFSLSPAVIFSQASYKYWVEFTDKKFNEYSTSHPEKFLSPAALLRRQRQHIPVTEVDLPVSSCYLDSIRKKGLPVIAVSKWLNGVIVAVEDTETINLIRPLSFVKEIKLVALPSLKRSRADSLKPAHSLQICNTPSLYGASEKQITLMNGHCLHQMGFRGKGMLIAVLDAGFFRVDSFRAFDSLRAHGKIIATRDFVNPARPFYATHSHGMSVLSLMGGNVPDTLTGTAPDASYALIITEDADSEYPVEEYLWACGAEYADSLGADIINSSLGYSSFDDARMNHRYADMNGETTPCARAAALAALRGMIVCISAGNEGGKSWNKIITPGDAKYCLTLGAVDSLGRYASFSSRGPSADGRIKPDLCTMGALAFVQTWNGQFGRGNGTSFASPLAAGMVASLWQAFPEKTNFEIMNAIRLSASFALNPNDSMGYGIPDFDKAFTILNQAVYPVNQPSGVNLWPNPFHDWLHIGFNSIVEEPFTVELIDLGGTIVYSHVQEAPYASHWHLMMPATLKKGFYLCRISSGQDVFLFKIIKQ